MARARALELLSLGVVGLALALCRVPTADAQQAKRATSAPSVPPSAPGADPAASLPSREQNWQACTGTEPNARIAGCSAILSGPRETRANVVVARRNRAAALRQTGAAAKALIDLDAAVNLEPRNAAVHVDRGSVLFELGHDDRSVQDFDRAIALDGKAAAAFVGRAAVLDRGGFLRRALADLDTAVKLSPGLGRAYSNRAHILLRLKETERALTDAERAVDLGPDDIWSRQVRGLVHRGMGNLPRALADFDRVVALSDGSAASLLLRGNWLVEARQPGRAIVDFGTVIAKEPRHAAALAGRARAHQLTGDHRSAFADAEAALGAEPRNIDAAVVRGELRLAGGEVAAALADFEAVLEIDDAHPRALLGRALARLGRGETDAAIVDLERAVAQPGSDADVLEAQGDALRRLAELKEKLALGAAPVGSTSLMEPAPNSEAARASGGVIDAPAWGLTNTRRECTLQARWADRAIVVLARAGLTGPHPGLQIALSLESGDWKAAAVPGPQVAPVRLSFIGSTAERNVEIALAGRASVRDQPRGAALDIGPIDLGDIRESLAKAVGVSASTGGVEIMYPTGDLWAWLPPFEACAGQLPRQ